MADEQVNDDSNDQHDGPKEEAPSVVTAQETNPQTSTTDEATPPVAVDIETAATTSETAAPSAVSEHVRIQIRPFGNAPVLRKSKMKMNRSDTVLRLHQFLVKQLKLDSSQQRSLFLYVNSSFAPSLDQNIGMLHNCFGTAGDLIINYGLTEAWG